jgi:cell division septation protein DedD
MVILAAGFAVTSVIVFLLGVLIGQGIEERKLLKKEEPLVKIPVEPLLQGSAGASSAKEEITFYDTLAKVPEGTGATQGKTEKASEKPAKARAAETRASKREAPAAETRDQVRERTDKSAWTVQVNAFPQEGDANRLAKRLTDKGYDAYVVTKNIRGKTWYRVRVGHFATRAEAKAMQEALKVKENLSQTMAVSR